MIPNKLPEGTTKEQWEQYEIELQAHEEYCRKCKPVIPDHNTAENMKAYDRKLSQWQMMCSCDAPNKPGYYRANND